MSLEFPFQPMHQQLSALLKGDVSAEELTHDYLDRISHYGTKLNAFMTVFYDSALQAAKVADQKLLSGKPLGALHGIPFGLKDIIEVEGQTTTWGSYALKNRISAETATVVGRLIGQGAIILGKTQSVEFALGGWEQTNSMEPLGIHGILKLTEYREAPAVVPVSPSLQGFVRQRWAQIPAAPCDYLLLLRHHRA